MSSTEELEAQTAQEAAGKERKELQAFLKEKGTKANGKTDELCKWFVAHRKRECGIADDAELPMKKTRAKKQKKKRGNLS